jgi:hypothetical protein
VRRPLLPRRRRGGNGTKCVRRSSINLKLNLDQAGLQS